MVSAENLLYIIIGIVLLEFIVEQILSYLNQKQWKPALPEELSGIYDTTHYIKSQEYAFAKEKLHRLSSVFSLTFSLFLLLKGFAWLDELVSNWLGNSIWTSLVFFGCYGLSVDIIHLPFEWYATFVIEEKFGFNKMTPLLFWTDKLKTWILSATVGGILLYVFIWLYQSIGNYFWIYAWLFFVLFMLAITMFYTTFIVPMFNKLTPLPEGELRTAIENYAHSVDFPINNIMVMDGSKRTTKANAYFSGIGKTKTIILYDTLIEKHSIPELVAILAHEVGHYKCKHVLKSILISAINTLILLYILQIFISEPVLSHALGAQEPKIHLGLIAFFLLYSPLSTITGLLFNMISRKNEFEADAFACQTSSGEALGEALKKLSIDTLSNLNPHPAYVFFYYSHPPLLERLRAIAQKSEEIVKTS
ncbi:MAG: M48 family metallopeptidase [Cytophagales bacterium]|nr:M48 family metallopeptidase [Cytophagales bacterium]MDW8384894.1 M48 family metallopeptidase [Flammeovirgaceae bacterium]